MTEENPPEDNLEKKLIDALGDAELEKEISATIENFHGFLTKEVALKLIARKKGILKRKKKNVKIGEIEKGQKKIDLHVGIGRIWPAVEYKSGKKSRVVEITDETGMIPLVLWNEDIGMTRNLRAGDKVEIENAYEKSGELHMGYSGSLKITKKADFADLDCLTEGKLANIRGIVSRIEGGKLTPTRLFVFFISNGKKEVRTVIWNQPERGMTLAPGDEIIIENALIKSGELQVYDDARLFSRRPGDFVCGELKTMETNEDTLAIVIDENKLTMERNDAMEFLGVRMADDIKLATVVNLKKGSMLNNKIALKIKK